MNKKYIIYTDGGCRPNPGPGGYGIVILDEDMNELKRSSGGEKSTTNNRMEYLGSINAIKTLEEIDQNIKGSVILIHTDSNLLVQTFNDWMRRWEKNNWKRSGKDSEIKNLDLVKILFDYSVKYPQLRFVWVKAHVGIKHNELVDQLATEAREKIERE